MELNQPLEPWASAELLGQWLSLRTKLKPILGNYIWVACEGTNINPLVLACVGYVHSKGFTLGGDVFACGIDGKLEDQIVNASIALQYMTLDDLSLTQNQLHALESTYDGMVTWMRSSLDSGKSTTSHSSAMSSSTEAPTPDEQPTPPQAEPSVPETVQEPELPPLETGRWTCRDCHFSNNADSYKCAKCGNMRPELQQWWICRRCEQINPPLGKTCLKCHATQGGIVILPPPAHPKPPRVELPGGGTIPLWLVRLRGLVNTMSLVFSLVQFMIPKPVAMVVRAVLSALKLILNQIWRSIYEGNKRGYHWISRSWKGTFGAVKGWHSGK